MEKEKKPRKVMAKFTEKRTQQTLERSIELPTEVAEQYNFVPLPDKGQFGRPFVTVFKDALLYILRYANLTNRELKLLNYLIASASAQNTIVTDLQEISQTLNIAKPHICTALKGLIKRNIVIKKATRKNFREPTTLGLELNFDQLNYNLAWNGKVKDYKMKKNDHPGLTDMDGHLLTEVAAEERRKLSNETKQPLEISQSSTDNQIFLTADGKEYDMATGEIIRDLNEYYKDQIKDEEFDTAYEEYQKYQIINGEE